VTLSLADTRDVLVSFGLCLAGAVVAPVLPMVGFPLCALALARLAYRGRAVPAAVIAGVAVAFAALLRPSDAVLLGPGLIAVLVAAGQVRRSRALTVSILLVPALALSFAMGEFANAWLMGLTYREYVAQIAVVVEPAMAGLSAAGAVTGEALVDSIVRFAPSGYVVLAVVTAVPTMLVIGRAGARTGTEVNRLPSLDRVDLSPHILWLPILALLGMAAGRFTGDPEGLVATVGLNLLLVARIALFVQGLAVVSSWLRTMGVGRTGRVFAYGAAFLADSATWVVSLMGLVDFWVNLRKIDRGDSGEPETPDSVA